MNTINALIIDDEQLAIDTLKWQIKEFCPSIRILETFTNPTLAHQFLEKNKINLCFLDIDMPEMSGFEFLRLWQKLPFDVIFTTAYSEFAIKAFKVSAFDYLLKPIDEEELVLTIEKYQTKNSTESLPEQLNLLINQLQKPTSYSSRVALPSTEGIHILDVATIIRLEADKNYTTVYTKTEKIIVCKSLIEVEKSLNPKQFFRIHQSHSINVEKISMYHRGRGGSISLTNGDKLPVSKYKKEALLALIQ